MIDALMSFGLLVLVIFIILLINAFPLYFTVKLLGGKATISKVILVNIYAWIVFVILEFILGLMFDSLTVS